MRTSHLPIVESEVVPEPGTCGACDTDDCECPMVGDIAPAPLSLGAADAVFVKNMQAIVEELTRAFGTVEWTGPALGE